MSGLESKEELPEFDVVEKGKRGGALGRKANKVW